jgi:hypothetical protein
MAPQQDRPNLFLGIVAADHQVQTKLEATLAHLPSSKLEEVQVHLYFSGTFVSSIRINSYINETSA